MTQEQKEELEACLRGFYTNSFFHIYTAGDFNVDVSKIATTKDKGTALHEYTHYIQNIGTLWGLYCSMYTYDMILQFKYEIINAQDIRRPFAFPLNESLVKKKKYVEHGNGTNWYPKWNIKADETIDYSLTTVDVNGKKKVQVDVSFTLIEGTKQFVQLGAHIIKESMAAMMQSLLDPDAKHDDVPYNLVFKLAAKHFENASKDINKLICCCYASLFSMSPGKTLIELLEEAELEPQLNGFQLFDRFIHTKEVVTGRRVRKTMLEFFNDMVTGFKSKLSDNLVAPLDYIAVALDRVRLDGQYYPFLSLLYDNGGLSEKSFTDIIGYYGVPYVQTLQHGYYYPKNNGGKGNDASIDVLELIVQEALFRNFVDAKRMSVCPLYYMCQTSKWEKPECFDKPWEGSACSYTIVSDALGLRGKKIE